MPLRLLWLGNSFRSSLRPSLGSPPLLYTSLDQELLKKLSANQRGFIPRVIRYGEARWHGLSQHPASSIRGRVYQIGCRLIDSIPVQERMLWRIGQYLQVMGDGKVLPEVEVGPSDRVEEVRESLRGHLAEWTREHARWRLIHGMAIVPAVVLSVLPFVKMWLAWEVFRTVTHHRAYVASRWLQQSQFVPQRTLEAKMEEEIKTFYK